MNDDKTLLIPWKPTPEDPSKTLAYNLINEINFSLQRIVKEQEHINDILHNSPQSFDDIITNMGEDGPLWMNVYNETINYITNLASFASKVPEDILPSIDIMTTTATLSKDVGTGKLINSGDASGKPILEKP
jgi:hypothetical protein